MRMGMGERVREGTRGTGLAWRRASWGELGGETGFRDKGDVDPGEGLAEEQLVPESVMCLWFGWGAQGVWGSWTVVS